MAFIKSIINVQDHALSDNRREFPRQNQKMVYLSSPSSNLTCTFHNPRSCLTHSPLDNLPLYGFGIWIVLLTIKLPCTTKSPTMGWTSCQVPSPQIPNGISACVHPLYAQNAIRLANANEVGMGVPSKYCDFPEASLGSMATVTLKRARRVRPQSTKMVRKMWSRGVRMPRENAAAAGETPKETCRIVESA